MNAHYKTLETIFNIVHQDPNPITYLCRPREIILRQFQDWSVIQQHLELLEQEGLVLTKQMDTLIVSITSSGIQKMESTNLDLQH
jgi:predicted transcriptional regulator